MEENFDLNLEKIVNLAKRRGFIFPGSEIYGGLSGTWDYGPLGVALKENIKNSWRRKFATSRNDMYELDSAILMNPQTWVTSGHTEVFTDPMVECVKCKRRFREDQIEGNNCPDCGGKFETARQFNLMFETRVGALEDSSSKTYLRPETAQGIFVNFKNIIDTFHPKLPFGVAQIGKAFRNEITPRDFTYRLREFEIMEFEYFIHPNENWEILFDQFLEEQKKWLVKSLSLSSLEIQKFSFEEYSSALPAVEEKVYLFAKNVYNKSSSRLFLSPNQFNVVSTVPLPNASRKYDFEISSNYLDIDSITYLVPKGYIAEYLPEKSKVVSKFGEYEAEAQKVNDRIIYTRKMKMKKGLYPASAFNEWVEFRKKIVKLDKNQIVLVQEK